MPDLFLIAHSVTSPKPESHSLLTALPRTACARTQSYSTSSWKTQRRVLVFISVYFFWWGRRGEREVGKFFISLPPLSSPVKHTSFSSSKNKNCDPCPWHDGHIDVPNQSRGSWTLYLLFILFQYSPVSQSDCHKHIHFSNTILWVFTSLFYLKSTDITNQLGPLYMYIWM